MQLPFTLKAAGKAWHQKGRYGSMLGRHPVSDLPFATSYSRESDAVDHVKVINSGPNSLTAYARETPPQFDRDALRAIILRARDDGRNVMIHANGRLPVQTALEAGCHSIEHGFFMGRENLERMADKKIFWVPTACAMLALLKNSTLIDKSNNAVIEQNLQHQLKQISFARECGVPVALGTDSGSLGVFHGKAIAEELNLFLEAGYSLSEAIRCATRNGAELLGLEDKGCIAKEGPADFLVFRSTPDELLKNLSSPQAIFLNGHPWQKDTVHLQ
jgi:imidazolonepropionase-like amidohydrolase